jgi:2'-5' RNA ligase
MGIRFAALGPEFGSRENVMLCRRQWNWTMLAAAIAVATEAKSQQQRNPVTTDADHVIAIDVLLVPDETTQEKAVAANARLRQNYPQCYTLGPDQVPHITLAQVYVREKDLPQIEANISKLAILTQPLRCELTATGYTYAIWSGVAITTIGVERTRQLDDFQVDVVQATDSSRVDGGTATAFSTNRELPKIDQDIVDYVENFARNSSGKNYHPHVTIGVAHEDFVKRMQAEPFERFTFRPAGLAIYQLGNFGTAQKKLWEWKPGASDKGRD